MHLSIGLLHEIKLGKHRPLSRFLTLAYTYIIIEDNSHLFYIDKGQYRKVLIRVYKLSWTVLGFINHIKFDFYKSVYESSL